jgi:hypothetical protein
MKVGHPWELVVERRSGSSVVARSLRWDFSSHFSSQLYQSAIPTHAPANKRSMYITAYCFVYNTSAFDSATSSVGLEQQLCLLAGGTDR